MARRAGRGSGGGDRVRRALAVAGREARFDRSRHEKHFTMQSLIRASPRPTGWPAVAARSVPEASAREVQGGATGATSPHRRAQREWQRKLSCEFSTLDRVPCASSAGRAARQLPSDPHESRLHHTRLRQEHRRQRALPRAARRPRRRVHRRSRRRRGHRRQHLRLHRRGEEGVDRRDRRSGPHEGRRPLPGGRRRRLHGPAPQGRARRGAPRGRSLPRLLRDGSADPGARGARPDRRPRRCCIPACASTPATCRTSAT